MITPRQPNNAGAIRQPSESVRYAVDECWPVKTPCTHSEAAINHFPTGGWTMNM